MMTMFYGALSGHGYIMNRFTYEKNEAHKASVTLNPHCFDLIRELDVQLS